jgi:hypothetical protein
MKNSPLTTFLLAVLALSTVLSVVFCGFYIYNTRELRKLQGQMTFINGRTSAITSLANDTLEYSKRNPAIDPILEAFNIKQKVSPTSSKPAGR